MIKPIGLLISGSLVLVLVLSGCMGVNAKSVGAGPWDIIPQDEIAFSQEEESQLTLWKKQSKPLFQKLQNHSLKMKAVIEVHNKLAYEHNKKLREQLGFTDSDLDALKSENLK